MPDRWEAGRGEGAEAGRGQAGCSQGPGGMSGLLLRHKYEATCAGPLRGGQRLLPFSFCPPLAFLSPTPSPRWHLWLQRSIPEFFVRPSLSASLPKWRKSHSHEKEFLALLGSGGRSAWLPVQLHTGCLLSLQVRQVLGTCSPLATGKPSGK